MADIVHKRGDSFVRQLAHFDGAAMLDLTGWTISSQVRTQTGDIVATLTVSNRNDPAGTFVLSAGATTTWPVGTLHTDIQYTRPDGFITSTQTLVIDCVADITRPA